jgi:hypothetical protein
LFTVILTPFTGILHVSLAITSRIDIAEAATYFISVSEVDAKACCVNFARTLNDVLLA